MLLSQEEIEEALKECIPGATRSEIKKAARTISAGTGVWGEVDLNENLGAVLLAQCRDIGEADSVHPNGFRIRAFVRRQP